MAIRSIPSIPEPDPSVISNAEVAAALDLILASEVFAHVERPSRFLRHLVETAMQGQQVLLKETLLGVQVFGRDPSWDTRIDPVVRQEAARLRKRLAKYYETAAPEVRIELPVGTYVPVFSRVASPVSQGEAPQSDDFLPAVPKTASPTWRRAVLAITAAVLCVGGIVWVWPLFRTPSVGYSPSIVIMPFSNLSADPANGYFADGLTDELTDTMSRLKSLRVLPRASALAYKGKRIDVREVGRSLNVSHVLQGSVDRSGDVFKISAHLERASDGAQVWSRTFERQAKDLLTVHSELATAVARSLQMSSTGIAAPPHVPSEEARQLCRRAATLIQAGTPASLTAAGEQIRQATKIDPEWGLPWFLLGVTTYNLPLATGRIRTQAELSETRNLMHKALELDPRLSMAHANLALIGITYEWDWAGAERELQMASRNGPNSMAENVYGTMSGFRGRFVEAERHIELAHTLAPADVSISSNRAAILYWESRFPQAIAIALQMVEDHPDQLAPQVALYQMYAQAGQGELALKNLRQLVARFPRLRIAEVMALGRSGQREEGLRLVRQLENQYGSDSRVCRQWFALAWAALGDHAKTVEWLKKSADVREFMVLNLAVNPAFAEMRNDPEFRALVKRIGL